MVKVNSHKSVRIQKLASVKRALISTCMKHGITDINEIRALSIKAVSAIKPMTIPSLKGWYGHNLEGMNLVE